MKGTGKLWHPSNAEAMLQLLAWSLRDDGLTLKNYLTNRPGCVFRRRPTPEPAPSLATYAGCACPTPRHTRSAEWNCRAALLAKAMN